MPQFEESEELVNPVVSKALEETLQNQGQIRSAAVEKLDRQIAREMRINGDGDESGDDSYEYDDDVIFDRLVQNRNRLLVHQHSLQVNIGLIQYIY